MDRFFDGHEETKTQRLIRLRQHIAGYVFQPEVLELILRAYNDYTNHGVYPWPGGLMAQPEWVIKAFDTLSSIGEVIKLERQRVSLEGLPIGNDVLGVPPTE